MEMQATTDKGIAIVYGSDPSGFHGRFVQLQHPQIGKEQDDFIFFSIDDRLGLEINETVLKLDRRGGVDWFYDTIAQVFEQYGIADDIYERIINEIS